MAWGQITGPIAGSDPWVPDQPPTYNPSTGGWDYHKQVMPTYNINPIEGTGGLEGTQWLSMPQGYNPWGTGAFDAVAFPSMMGGGLTEAQIRNWGKMGFSPQETLLMRAEYQSGMVNALKQQQLMGIYGRQTDAAQGTFGSREEQQAAEQAQRGLGFQQRMLSMQDQVPGMWDTAIGNYGQQASQQRQGLGQEYAKALGDYTRRSQRESIGLQDAYGNLQQGVLGGYGALGQDVQSAYGDVGGGIRGGYRGAGGEALGAYGGAGEAMQGGYGNVASVLGAGYGELASGLGQGYQGMVDSIGLEMDPETSSGLARIQEKFEDERGRLTQQARASGLVSSRDMNLQSRLARDQQIAEQDYMDKLARRREGIQLQGLGVQQQVGMGRLGASGQALMGGAAGYGQARMGGADAYNRALMAGEAGYGQAAMGGAGAYGGALMAGQAGYGQVGGQALGQRGRDIGAMMSGRLGLQTAGLGALGGMRQAELAQRGGWVSPQVTQQYGLMTDWGKSMGDLGQEYAGYGQGRFGQYLDTMYGQSGLGNRYAGAVERMSGMTPPDQSWFASAAAQQVGTPKAESFRR
jgi:hypothetical protein